MLVRKRIVVRGVGDGRSTVAPEFITPSFDRTQNAAPGAQNQGSFSRPREVLTTSKRRGQKPSFLVTVQGACDARRGSPHTGDMTDGSGDKDVDDREPGSGRKGRSDAEFGFYVSAVGSVVFGLWLWPTFGPQAWIALLPAVVLLGLGLLARWVHKS